MKERALKNTKELKRKIRGPLYFICVTLTIDKYAWKRMIKVLFWC